MLTARTSEAAVMNNTKINKNVDPIALANSVIYRAYKDKKTLTYSQVQALLLLINKRYYANTKVQLLTDDEFDIKSNMLTIPSITQQFEYYDPNKLATFIYDDNKEVYYYRIDGSDELSMVINNIWKTYKDYNKYDLLLIVRHMIDLEKQNIIKNILTNEY
jgi:uncharacterized phage-associated protein